MAQVDEFGDAYDYVDTVARLLLTTPPRLTSGKTRSTGSGERSGPLLASWMPTAPPNPMRPATDLDQWWSAD